MINIRQATEADLAAILDLYRQPDLDGEVSLSIPQAKEQFARIQTYPNYHLYVAELNGAKGALVGTFALLIMDNLLHVGRPSGIVEAVAVASSCQGQVCYAAMPTGELLQINLIKQLQTFQRSCFLRIPGLCQTWIQFCC
jgi:hypothetical protein